MIEIDTGSKTVFRFDNVLDNDACDQIYKYATEFKHNKKNDGYGNLPWNDGDHFSWYEINNSFLKKQILTHRETVSYLIREKLKLCVYPEFTDIVLWRTGKEQLKHKDNGCTPNDILRRRVVSCVTYVNDNFEGGETFIKTENGSDYISKPKKGGVVFYLSNSTNEHGVNKILSGLRVTLPVWFCTDQQYSEDLRDAEKILKFLKAGFV
jgi:hypothetical protein